MRWKFVLAAPLLALAIGGAAQAQGLTLSDADASDGTRFIDQLRTETPGPVVLINIFEVPAAEGEAFQRRWTAAADVLRKKPGFLSTTLHQGTAGSRLWLNRAEWRSLKDFAQAMGSDDFLAIAKTISYPGFRRVYTAEPTLGPLALP